jgi:cytochrome c-type biogenesis protein CcmH
MMTFWMFAILLIAIALCYVLPPLLQRAERTDDDRKRANVSIYRDQFDELERDLRDGVLDKEQYEQGRLELQRRLLEDVSPDPDNTAPPIRSEKARKPAALLMGAAIPLLAVVLYFQIGTPAALGPNQPVAAMEEDEEATDAPAGMPGQPTKQEIEARVAKLAARLKDNPGDGPGWVMLARSYQQFKRYKEASEAYERATAIKGDDAQLWVDYAESVALANNSQLEGRPTELVNKALQLDPNNNKALWLAGTAAFEAEDFEKALSYWERLAKLLPKGSEAARSIESSIEEARARIR